MKEYIDAGRLDTRLEVLELRETAENIFEWAEVRKTWAQVTRDAKRNLFSSVGIGARNAEIVVRGQALTLHNALRWRGQHFFLTAITPRGRGHLDVSAALVELTACVGRPMTAGKGKGNRPCLLEGEPVRFPGVLTEKYMGYDKEKTYAVSRADLVLVTPKEVRLEAGDLVDAQGETYNVRVAHSLDPWKNEYEINLRKDV